MNTGSQPSQACPNTKGLQHLLCMLNDWNFSLTPFPQTSKKGVKEEFQLHSTLEKNSSQFQFLKSQCYQIPHSAPAPINHKIRPEITKAVAHLKWSWSPTRAVQEPSSTLTKPSVPCAVFSCTKMCPGFCQQFQALQCSFSTAHFHFIQK